MSRVIYDESRRLLAPLASEQVVKRYLNAFSGHHPPTRYHSERVGLLAVDLGIENGMEQDELNDLGYSGLLHDIGKLKIPRAVLQIQMPARPTPEEVALLRNHPRAGFQMLAGESRYDRPRMAIVGHHEFKPDAYPRSKSNVQAGPAVYMERRQQDPVVMEMRQILAVCDIFDAMTTRHDWPGNTGPDSLEARLSAQFTGNPKYVGQVLSRYEPPAKQK